MTTINKEIITNGAVSFNLNRDLTKAALWEQAQAAGFTGGRTSFMNLLSGKAKSACGFEIQIQVPVAKTEKAARPTVNKTDALATLAAASKREVNVIEAKTETYGTVSTSKGRVQVNPMNNGTFSLMFFPLKGVDMAEVATLLGEGNVKSQYMTLGKKDLASVTAILNKLA